MKFVNLQWPSTQSKPSFAWNCRLWGSWGLVQLKHVEISLHWFRFSSGNLCLVKIAIKSCWISKCPALIWTDSTAESCGMLLSKLKQVPNQQTIHGKSHEKIHTNLALPGCARDSGSSCWCGSQISWEEGLIWGQPVLDLNVAKRCFIRVLCIGAFPG